MIRAEKYYELHNYKLSTYLYWHYQLLWSKLIMCSFVWAHSFVLQIDQLNVIKIINAMHEYGVQLIAENSEAATV